MGNIIKITDFYDERLDIYARLKEVELQKLYHPKPGIFIAESPKVIERALDAGYEPISCLVEEKQILGESRETMEILSRCGNLPIFTADFDTLTQLTGYSLTRGMLCAMYRKPLPQMKELCECANRIVILENVVNPTNIGAIFRSAAALGIDAVLLTQCCSNPLYRRSIRVSMGTVFQVPWTYFSSETEIWPQKAMESLHEYGFKTVAMALTEEAISIDDSRLLAEEKLAIILGTEGEGLAADTMADCDYKTCIPMSHGVDSLNVAAAGAVAFWQLRFHKS